MLRKAVITAAGLGTRLLPATKEQPKEMLPIFTRSANGGLCVKPFIQIVFEQLYDAGFRDFCFIVGKKSGIIEQHFTWDNGLVGRLLKKNKVDLINELSDFYKKASECNIVFINQIEPRGFGDAVFYARSFTKREPFLVHAGDDLILSKSNQWLKRLIQIYKNYNAEAVFCVEKVKDPRKYGVITGKRISTDLYIVSSIKEKPSSPPSNLAAIAIYIFSPKIYDAIKKTIPDINNEIQLTDAIQYLVNNNHNVYALELKKGERRMDIGTPESYWQVLENIKRYFTSLNQSSFC